MSAPGAPSEATRSHVQTSRLFGWARKGGDISAALHRSLIQLEADAEVVEDAADRCSMVSI